MRQRLTLTFLLLALLPYVAKAQWTFDIVSVEAYINDHKKQRSLLLARSTLEYSNKLLHEYSKDATVEYKELNVGLMACAICLKQTRPKDIDRHIPIIMPFVSVCKAGISIA